MMLLRICRITELCLGREVPEQPLMVRAEPQELYRSPFVGGYQLDEPHQRVVRDGVAIGKVNPRQSRSRQLFDRIVGFHGGGEVKGPMDLQRELQPELTRSFHWRGAADRCDEFPSRPGEVTRDWCAPSSFRARAGADVWPRTRAQNPFCLLR